MTCLKHHALINSLKRYEKYGFQSRTDGQTLVDIILFLLFSRRYKLSIDASFMKYLENLKNEMFIKSRAYIFIKTF